MGSSPPRAGLPSWGLCSLSPCMAHEHLDGMGNSSVATPFQPLDSRRRKQEKGNCEHRLQPEALMCMDVGLAGCCGAGVLLQHLGPAGALG